MKKSEYERVMARRYDLKRLKIISFDFCVSDLGEHIVEKQH